MKAKSVSRFGLALLAVGLVVSLGSSQLYAAPVLGPDQYSIVAAPKPDSPADKGDKSNNGSSQGAKAGGQNNANSGDKGSTGGGNGSGKPGGGGSNPGSGGSNAGSGSNNAGGNGGNPNASSEVKPPYPADGPGANKSGPYNVNPDKIGDPSANGNGNGNAVNKPGMGTVGNADGKNPPGQVKNYPNGNGYECGGNNGIAKGNPAHTPQDCSAGGGTVNPPINPPGDDKGNGGDDDKGKDGNGDQNGGGNSDNGGNGGTTPPGQEDKGTPPGQDKGATPDQDTAGTPADGNTPGDGSHQGGTDSTANPSTSDGSGNGEPQLTDESGQLGRSSAGALRAGVLGVQASATLEDLEGQGSGLSGNSPSNAPLGAGAASAAPGVLPYTGEADEVSQAPVLWAIASLVLMFSGMLFRRMALAVAMADR